MARGSMTDTERHCFANAKSQPNNIVEYQEKTNGEVKANGLRVRFLDDEGKTERTVTTDEVDCAVSRVKKIHLLKNRSSSETSILLRHSSLGKRRASADRRFSDAGSDNLNNNSSSENLNGRITPLKHHELDKTDPATDKTKETHGHYKKNCNVYNVNQARTLTAERKKSIPLIMSKRLPSKGSEPASGAKSSLPSEVCLADAAFGKEFTARALGRLTKGLGRLLRRTNSVRISEPDPVYKVAYLGNVLTGWARGESCIEKPLATLWRNYQQTTKPDVVMKLSVTNSGLKGFTKEHGLTEYWSHRITYCASPPHYPKLFCWVYRHEGKKLKHELRCHAVLCTKETVSKKITEDLQVKLKQALVEFKKDRISKQNARLSLANSVYDNPSMPRRKIMLSVGATNYRPPLERSKSAPKLGAIEELCSEEDEEEAEMKERQGSDSWRSSNQDLSTLTLDRRRHEKSPRKLSCPEGVMDRIRYDSDSKQVSEEVIKFLIDESIGKSQEDEEASQNEARYHRLESIEESAEVSENCPEKAAMLSAGSYLVTDSDDGSVSSGCETASTATSDTEPSSLPPHYPPPLNDKRSFDSTSTEEVNHIPIGETTSFQRRCTYPPLGTDSSILADFENKFESLTENGDFDSMHSCGECGEVGGFQGSGDNESACSDESGYSELLDNKDSIIGNTIMV